MRDVPLSPTHSQTHTHRRVPLPLCAPFDTRCSVEKRGSYHDTNAVCAYQPSTLRERVGRSCRFTGLSSHTHTHTHTYIHTSIYSFSTLTYRSSIISSCCIIAWRVSIFLYSSQSLVGIAKEVLGLTASLPYPSQSLLLQSGSQSHTHTLPSLIIIPLSRVCTLCNGISIQAAKLPLFPVLTKAVVRSCSCVPVTIQDPKAHTWKDTL